MHQTKYYCIIILSLFWTQTLLSQSEKVEYVDYKKPGSYVVDHISISGVENLDHNILINMTGLSIGQRIKIPGTEITNIVKKFWNQGLFEDVQVSIDKKPGNKVYVDIFLKERPRLKDISFSGMKKSDQEDIQESLELQSGRQITQNVLNNTEYVIKEHYKEKGYYNTSVKIKQTPDSAGYNRVNLFIEVDRKQRVKIQEIKFYGNNDFTTKRLRRVLKKTKQKDLNIFKGSKFIEEKYNEDMGNLARFYGKNGYRNFELVSDSIEHLDDESIILHLKIDEGNKFYFRDIKWVGNTKYSTELLSRVLGVKKGDVYNKEMFDNRLNVDEDAVSSIYMDNGYLFFSATPVELGVDGDSIDVEVMIYEGKQARINNVIIKGNTKTHEHVIRRELKTNPGDLFSKSDIIRSVRELAALGHFNPEAINPVPIPNQNDGTVDIEYNLEEKANDQLELSGGWGGIAGFIGTIGVRFTNFSVKRALERHAWRPVPSGDGQTLSIRGQSNGRFYQNASFTFVEPWLGGKKPNNLNVSVYGSKFTDGGFFSTNANDGELKIFGSSVGLGTRLKWPDDFFTLYGEVAFQRYNNEGYSRSIYSFLDDGVFKVLSGKVEFRRNSQDQLIFPRKGSNFGLSLEATPRYSFLSESKQLTFTEYHKWKFDAKHFLSIVGNLVLYSSFDFGSLARYDRDGRYSPIGGFQVGGDLFSGFRQYGVDLVPVRGYNNAQLSPPPEGSLSTDRRVSNVYSKFSFELRYPVSLNPQATFYVLTFAEGGRGWNNMSDFNPFDFRRSYGVGLRAFLPMFGMLGVDFGIPMDDPFFDAAHNQKGKFHFTLGQQF